MGRLRDSVFRLDARGIGDGAGYTLIEMLIVIVVLGALASIVALAVGRPRAQAVTAVCAADVKAIESSADAVLSHSGSYPTVDLTQSDPQARFSDLLAGSGKGGMLRRYPAAGDYVLEYVAASHTVNVFPAGTPYSTGVAMSAGALGADSGGCSALG